MTYSSNPSQSSTESAAFAACQTPCLTPRALAAYLGVQVGTLAKWRCTGEGPEFFFAGRHVRYTPTAVQIWVAARSQRSTTNTPSRRDAAA